MKDFKLMISVHVELHWPKKGIKYIWIHYQCFKIGRFYLKIWISNLFCKNIKISYCWVHISKLQYTLHFCYLFDLLGIWIGGPSGSSRFYHWNKDH